MLQEIRTIVPDTIYHWGDHAPNIGLEQITHLSLDEKRQDLFGRCDIDRYVTTQHHGASILFDHYIDLEMPTQGIEKIFFPVFFLSVCQKFKDHFGPDWIWNDHRAVSMCLPMNKMRYPRILASCWAAQHTDHTRLIHTQTWEPQEQIDLLYELLQIGGLKDWTGAQGPDLVMLPKKIIESNHGAVEHKTHIKVRDVILNFNQLYRDIYAPAAACVVIGTACWEYGCTIDEKYLNAIYSGCIPVVHGHRVYDRLRDLGFDVFDDIIDTSSQYQCNPVMAVWDLMEKNQYFFKNALDIRRDPAILERLHNNLSLAQDVKILYQRSLDKLNSPNASAIFRNHRREIWQYFWFHKLPYDEYDQ